MNITEHCSKKLSTAQKMGNIPLSWLEKLLSFECVCYLKQSMYFSDVFLKIPMAFLRLKKKKPLKIHMKSQKTQNSQRQSGRGRGEFSAP